MAQVSEGWQTDYVIFGREGFSESLQTLATAYPARLVSLEALEDTLLENDK